MRTARALIAVVAGLFVVQSALAFNHAGHMVIGAIAYKTLKDTNPAALASIVTILHEHPHYASMWKEKLDALPEERRNLVLFMLAARWPDDMRDTPAYHRGSWHYINFPYKQPGDTIEAPQPTESSNLTKAFIIQAFRHNAAIASGSDPDSDKAIALCWILHLVGDVHQPLHTVALFSTTQFPHGDVGGNIFFIRRKVGTETLPLHTLWDDLVLMDEKFDAVDQRANSLRDINPRIRFPQLAQIDLPQFASWAEIEGPKLAETAVYREGTLKASVHKDNGEPLPDDYSDTAEPIAQRRATLAGYRLAAVLAGSVLTVWWSGPSPF